jgi:hypothetical protein
MAVSDQNMSDALTYLAADPHPLAVAKFNLTVAENKSRETFAKLFLASDEKTNDARKASVECDPAFAAIKQSEADAVLEYERHRSRTKAADMLIECWRTEQSNIRAAERVR